MTDDKSKYWLDVAVDKIFSVYPDTKQEIIISSGISASASYHIGHFREILTADALKWAVIKAGRKAKHIHVVDNFDPLRRRYSFLPKSYEQYVGQPVCLIPDPFPECAQKHKTYSEHYYKEFEVYASQMGICPDEVIRSFEDLYKTGKMANRIEEVLENQKEILKILKGLSNRELDADWTGVMVLGENNKFSDAPIEDWDKPARTIGGIKFGTGRAKLTWRLDWPARWKILGVMVEPFSKQEHGAAGGSYDTGKIFARKIFDINPPLPGVMYGNIHMPGDTIKMSSSKGNLVTPKQALEIMPPEALRYYVVRSRPEKTLYFDSGEGLYNLIDEFSKAADDENHPFKEAYEFASTYAGAEGKRVVSNVPFKHLVAVYQAALKDFNKTISILKRSQYKQQAEEQTDVVKKELEFIDSWLEKYAPDSIKFELQPQFPSVDLNQSQRKLLADLATKIAQSKKEPQDGQWYHEAIHELRDKYNLEPNEAFGAIYRVLLNKDYGPKAGWFLSILDQDMLVNRFRLEA